MPRSGFTTKVELNTPGISIRLNTIGFERSGQRLFLGLISPERSAELKRLLGFLARYFLWLFLAFVSTIGGVFLVTAFADWSVDMLFGSALAWPLIARRTFVCRRLAHGHSFSDFAGTRGRCALPI